MTEKDKIEDINEDVVDEQPIEDEIGDHEKRKSSFSKKKDDKEKVKIKELQSEIITLKEEAIALKNDYFKAYADAENTKKRLQQDFALRSKYMIQNFAMEMLSVIDNLERAMDSAEKDTSLYTGIDMVHQQLLNALNKEGVEVIDALGAKFDPNYHHAIMTEAKEGVESNIVIEVLQKGYKLKDRILRAALVKVSE